jgi:hypothetical protein
VRYRQVRPTAVISRPLHLIGSGCSPAERVPCGTEGAGGRHRPTPSSRLWAQAVAARAPLWQVPHGRPQARRSCVASASCIPPAPSPPSVRAPTCARGGFDRLLRALPIGRTLEEERCAGAGEPEPNRRLGRWVRGTTPSHKQTVRNSNSCRTTGLVGLADLRKPASGRLAPKHTRSERWRSHRLVDTLRLSASHTHG